MNELFEQLGRGVRFPLRPVQGRLGYVAAPEVVGQSIETILTTEPGERLGLPTFGCGLRHFIMQPNNTATRALMAYEINQALELWEPRIILRDVAVTAGDDPSLVWIEISYVHRADQSPGNLVFPFYLR